MLSIKPANGGGYVLTGIAVGDFWVAKIDEDANVIWQKLIGGMWADDAMDVVTASDGGYIVTGYSQSADRDVIGNHGSFDMVVFKVDENGNKVWLKCFGGTQDDYGYSLSKTNDGGYIVTGFTKSNDGDVTGNHGNTDMWVIKIDVNGNKVWQKTFGGSDREIANRIISTADGNFIIAGSTYSNDGDITGFHGYMDGCIVKLDGNGNKIWQKSLGGSDYDDVFSVLETSAGKYMAVGSTWSNDGDVVGYKGDSDGWLMKF